MNIAPDKALPMTTITGYLGAGKTTFINELLKNTDGKRITVLVNDFGEISLDETLISNQHGDVIALANGCMCCQIGGDLYRTIDKILKLREKIDHLVVETSGVADPSKISQIADAEPDLLNNGIMTVIDALNHLELLGDQSLLDTLDRQIAGADFIFLSKHGNISQETISEVLLRVHNISGNTPIYYSRSEIQKIIFDTATPTGGQKSTNKRHGSHIHEVPFDSWSWRGHEQINSSRFFKILNHRNTGIYRLKAILRFDDGSCRIVNKVGSQIKIEPYTKSIDESMITVIGPAERFTGSEFEEVWYRDLVIPQKEID